MATAAATASVVSQTFNPGTNLGGWRFRLLQNGLPAGSLVSASPSAAFSVAPGTYRVDAARLMADNSLAQVPVQSGEFTVAAPEPVVGDIVASVSVSVTA